MIFGRFIVPLSTSVADELNQVDSFSQELRKAVGIVFVFTSASHKYQTEIALLVFVVCSKLLTTGEISDSRDAR